MTSTSSTGAVAASNGKPRERSYILKKRASDADFLPRPATASGGLGTATGRAAGKSTVKAEHWNLLSEPPLQSLEFDATGRASMRPLASTKRELPAGTVTYGTHSLLAWDDTNADRKPVTAASLRQAARDKKKAEDTARKAAMNGNGNGSAPAAAPAAAAAAAAAGASARPASAVPSARPKTPLPSVRLASPTGNGTARPSSRQQLSKSQSKPALQSTAAAAAAAPAAAAAAGVSTATQPQSLAQTTRSVLATKPPPPPVIGTTHTGAARAVRLDIAGGLGFGRKHPAHFVYLSSLGGTTLSAEQVALAEAEHASQQIERNQFAAATGYGHMHSNHYRRFYSNDVAHTKRLHELSFN